MVVGFVFFGVYKSGLRKQFTPGLIDYQKQKRKPHHPDTTDSSIIPLKTPGSIRTTLPGIPPENTILSGLNVF